MDEDTGETPRPERSSPVLWGLLGLMLVALFVVLMLASRQPRVPTAGYPMGGAGKSTALRPPYPGPLGRH